MAKKPQENPQLDMTPMIDVVFELIIFFVVTLVEAQKKDETIELEDGQHGIVLTPDQLPPMRMEVDIASRDKNGNKLPRARISMGDRTCTAAEIGKEVKSRLDRLGGLDFPLMIRADYDCPHEAVQAVMDACTAAGLFKISFVAIGEDKTKSRKRLKKY